MNYTPCCQILLVCTLFILWGSLANKNYFRSSTMERRLENTAKYITKIAKISRVSHSNYIIM
jgi:hypothetical protein